MMESGLERLAAKWRATCLKMSRVGRHGHLSSSLGYIEVLAFLYKRWLKLADNSEGPSDKFILSKGHGCSALYVALADSGLIPVDALSQYAKPGAQLGCHPCKHALNILETSSGSLGQGLGVASGIALAQRLSGEQSNIVVLLGDGEMNEGSIWESLTFIKANQLNNIIAIVDYNGVQAVGRTDRIVGGTDLEQKIAAFGWHAQTIDGNNFVQIEDAFSRLEGVTDRPKAIIAHTSLGIDYMSVESALWHYRIPSDDEYETALSQLDAEPMF